MEKIVKEVVITIDENGKVSADALGFAGVGCQDAINEITKNLGKVIETVKKKELNYKAKVQVDQKINNQ